MRQMYDREIQKQIFLLQNGLNVLQSDTRGLG